jgi:hypothetical protein
MLSQYYESYPWISYIITTLVVVVAAEFGHALGLRWARLRPDAFTSELLTLEGAALALLALMIGFTFAMALTRYNARFESGVDEANAISTTALRARMLPEPYTGRAHKLIEDYIRLRLAYARGQLDQAALAQGIDASNRLQSELWQQAAATTTTDPHSVPAELFATSLNRMIEMQTRRLAAARNRIPPVALTLLYGIAVVAVGLSGYVAGLLGKWGRIPHAVMAVMVATVIALVADIERPRGGLVNVNQRALLDLEANLDR